ncbi:MAG: hypothetical protein GXP63_01325 [DPANN group archaeon]|nr:hypothetical protein [DPANN group archaeon]
MKTNPEGVKIVKTTLMYLLLLLLLMVAFSGIYDLLSLVGAGGIYTLWTLGILTMVALIALLFKFRKSIVENWGTLLEKEPNSVGTFFYKIESFIVKHQIRLLFIGILAGIIYYLVKSGRI